ncbi:MAG: isochorismate synthase [archaeon]
MESARADPVGTSITDETLVVRGRQLDQPDPQAFLADGADRDRPWIVWNGPDERVTALGSASTVTANGPDRFEKIQRRASAVFRKSDVDPDLPSAAAPRFFGGFAFHEGEDDRHGEPDWRGFPDAQFVLPAVTVIQRQTGAWLTVAAVGSDAESTAERALDTWAEKLSGGTDRAPTAPPKIAGRTLFPDRAAWTEQLEAVLDRIERGDLRKVVLGGAQSVELAGDLSIPAALERLGETYPDCYRFAFQPDVDDAGTFFGATPERLLELSDTTVSTVALAGSTGRGETQAEDEWLAERLAANEKDRHEHGLVVEAIETQLADVAECIETGDRTVRQLATVQHLSTPIRATLADEMHVLSLVATLHPTPAVGGLPPKAALTAIRDAEAFDRGWYAAPIGWFDADGDGTFAVGIRSALARNRRATLFAGAGIVAESDPDEEWDEIQLKYRPILDAVR